MLNKAWAPKNALNTSWNKCVPQIVCPDTYLCTTPHLWGSVNKRWCFKKKKNHLFGKKKKINYIRSGVETTPSTVMELSRVDSCCSASGSRNSSWNVDGWTKLLFPAFPTIQPGDRMQVPCVSARTTRLNMHLRSVGRVPPVGPAHRPLLCTHLSTTTSEFYASVMVLGLKGLKMTFNFVIRWVSGEPSLFISSR